MTENSKEEKKVCYACGGYGFVYVYPDPGIDRSYRRDRAQKEICYVCGGSGYIRKEFKKEVRNDMS